MSEEHDRVVTVSILKTALNDLEKRLEKRISEEGATTRTHFNVMVERVESAVKLVAEVSSHHSTVLDDHEARPAENRKALNVSRRTSLAMVESCQNPMTRWTAVRRGPASILSVVRDGAR